jgi:hypothetical protein
VQRGKFVREQLLCQLLPPPPPDVDTTPPDPDPNATTRERFQQHRAEARCDSCHRLLDNLGFGLEAFDYLGRFRSEENGMPVDATGVVVDAGDPSLDGAFDGALELTSKLAQSPQVEACLATQWFRYTMGRAEQQALQRRFYGAARDEDVTRAFHDALATIKTAKVVVLGVPSDVGAGFRRGANLGPMAIRQRLLKDDPAFPEWAAAHGVVDVGDVFVVPQLLDDDMLSAEQLASLPSIEPLLPALSDGASGLVTTLRSR